MVYRIPTHGILIRLPMVFLPPLPMVYRTPYPCYIELQLQLQSGYLVTSASRHLAKDYIYTCAQQSLKVEKKQHIYTVQVYGSLEYSLDCHLECQPPTHGILTPYPWYIEPLTHGISPPIHWISNPLPMVF